MAEQNTNRTEIDTRAAVRGKETTSHLPRSAMTGCDVHQGSMGCIPRSSRGERPRSSLTLWSDQILKSGQLARARDWTCLQSGQRSSLDGSRGTSIQIGQNVRTRQVSGSRRGGETADGSEYRTGCRLWRGARAFSAIGSHEEEDVKSVRSCHPGETARRRMNENES